jgi:hypothetical protein
MVCAIIVLLGRSWRRKPDAPRAAGKGVAADAPPTVIVDVDGATAWLGGEPTFRIGWAQVERVAIQVVVVAELEYSEAFSSVDGGGAHLAAPLDIVVGAADLRARVMALPGFDHHALRMAELAEAKGDPGEFVCWTRVSQAERGPRS